MIAMWVCAMSVLATGQARQALGMDDRFASGMYRAVVRSPGGELPFILQLSDAGGKQQGWIINGTQKIEIPSVKRTFNHFTLDISHYDAVIELTVALSSRQVMSGKWKKRTGQSEFTEMDVSVEQNDGWLFKPNSKIETDVVVYPKLEGRWEARFGKDKELAVAVFKEGAGKGVEGTFLTPSGDYGYLSGSYEYGLLRLSNFDGAHAFLFVATIQPDGTLKGDFWSGAKWHEPWTAIRNDKVSLPDGFTATKVNPSNSSVRELSFRDLDGGTVSLGAPGVLGKATIIEVFGTWCPNCHDASDTLAGLEKKYGSRGLKVIGLAFELTPDFERSVKQIKAFQARHRADYRVLFGGMKDKSVAPRALPVLEGLKGYPTFLFVDGSGTVKSVYTGFSGPATGEEHERLRENFERVIEKLLAAG